MQPPMRCVRRPLATSGFTLPEAHVGSQLIAPPPPLKRWSVRLVHRARAPDQRFRVQAEAEDWGLSGLFPGTYSALPYATPCRVAPRTRPEAAGSRSSFRSVGTCIGQHGACPMQVHYSVSLGHWPLE
jgi:hypothetical protein